MPGFITHLALGEKTIPFIESTRAKTIINKHRNIYNLGLEGPDIFFYHIPAYLFYKHNIGNIMHSFNTMAFFDSLIDFRNQFEEETDREICDAYILGFIGHYTLDIFCHPYIYYKSNHWENLKKHNSKYDFGKHVSLETDIDHIILEKIFHSLPSEYNYASAISASKYEEQLVSYLLSSSIHDVYIDYYLSPLRVRKAINSIKKLNKAMNDPKGNKKSTLNHIELLLFKCTFISSMIPSNSKIIYEDPCNETNSFWSNPWDESLISHDSFFDLFNQACKDYLTKIEVYIKSIDADFDDEIIETNYILHYRNKLLSVLSDLSYLNGLPIKEPFVL